MKKKVLSAAVNLIYAFLNLFLILVCIIVPFYYSVIALTEPQTITSVIQTIDYTKLLKQTPSVEKSLKKYGIDSERADKLIKSKEAEEIIELYADEATVILLGIPETRKIDAALVKELVEDNIDNILTAAKEKTDIKFDEKKVKTEVKGFISENESEIEQYAPVLEQARTVVKQIKLSKIVARTLTLPFIIIFTAVMLLIASLIFVMKRRNFKGLAVLGIDFAAVSLALGGITYFCKSRFVTSLALEMSDFGVSIIESAVSVCADRIIIALIISAALMILSIMFLAALRYRSDPTAADRATAEVKT